MSKFARLKVAIRGEGADGAGVQGAPAEPAPLSPMDKRVKPPLVTRQQAIVAAAIAALIVVTGVFYVRYGLNSTLSVAGERLTVATAQNAVFQEYVPVTGNIEPATTVYLDAVEGGQVTQVFAEEGQMVEEGDPLLELKNTDLQLRLVEAESNLTTNVNNLNATRLQAEQTQLRHQRDLIDLTRQIITLERDLARNERLLEVDAVSAKTVEDMRTQLDSLRQLHTTVTEAQRIDREMNAGQTAQMQRAVDVISANLEVARENLENLVMKAPISGQLTVFEANRGESKIPGTNIGQIDDITAFKVSALVDEFYLGRVTIGQRATVEIGGQMTTLEISKVYPDVEERQFQIDLEFTEEQPQGLRRGQTLRMNLEIGAQAESLVVANGPWVDDTGGTWVFVLSPDGGGAQRRDVSIGRRNPDMVEIQSGLSPDDRVIVSSYASLLDFDRIDVRGQAGSEQ
jgi:HlyD family secretion protein